MSLDAAHFREGMSRFATGVCVVTTVDGDGVPAGVTISSFASVSLEPPLVLFCIGKTSTDLASWLEARHFSVNVLAAGQRAVCELFASHAADKFADGTRHDRGQRLLPACRRPGDAGAPADTHP
ncbi:MAG: flavin reductase family protein [Rhodospirillales bacterium]